MEDQSFEDREYLDSLDFPVYTTILQPEIKRKDISEFDNNF